MSKTDVHGEVIGVLTGGGDAPGLNAVIRGVTLGAHSLNYEVVGIRNGWAGLLGVGDVRSIIPRDVEGIHMLGGTILGTSRTNPYKHPNGISELKHNLIKNKIDYLVAIGGEDTLGVAKNLRLDDVNVVGVPKTIDNDVNCTDYTVGFDSALNTASEAITRLHTTASSHGRTLIVEVMGRHAGWLALQAGIAGGAHVILVPERPFNLEEVCSVVSKRRALGLEHTIIACSEGATSIGGEFVLRSEKVDEFNHVQLGGITEQLAPLIEEKTGIECKSVVLGYLQRSGPPSAFDRVLGTRFGFSVVEAVERGEFGRMVAVNGTEIVTVGLDEALASLKTVPKNMIDDADRYLGMNE
ncbi:MAG: ATP-dependent 6-phosphofructokinase [Candidatus Bathyarchaeia archaeon]|jgi:6-phosphofructokinase 1